MNNRIKKLYSCCLDNRVVVIESNYKYFYEAFKSIEPEGCYASKWYDAKFKASNDFTQTIGDKVYFFQRLI